MADVDDNAPRSLMEYVPLGTSPDQGWRRIREILPQWEGRPVLHDWGLEKLRAGLGALVKAVLVEPHYICKDHRDLFSYYYSRKFRTNPGICSRLHFFDNNPGDVPTLLGDPKNHQTGYLGFAVIRPVPERCLGRCVFSARKLIPGFGESVFCLSTPFKVRINGIELSVQGYPYMSQDREAMVCAHAALWGICRYLSTRYPTYREIHPFDLVKMTGKDQGRTYPRRGMVYRDFSTILTDFGAHPVIVNVKRHVSDTRVDPQRFSDLCTYVESGFPVLLAAKSLDADEGHAITAIGHTLDDKRGTEDCNRIIDHTDFFDRLVVVDDNDFPHRLLGDYVDPVGETTLDRGWSRFSFRDIHTAICPLPEKVFVTADMARLVLRQHLMDPDIWSELAKTGDPPWVTRLFLTTGHSFKSGKLKSARRWPLGVAKNLDYIAGLTSLPHFIWVMEAGPLALFQQRDRQCTAEIVLDATAGKNDHRAVLYTRVGRKLFFPESPKPHTCEDAERAFALFQHNLGEKDDDDVH